MIPLDGTCWGLREMDVRLDRHAILSPDMALAVKKLQLSLGSNWFGQFARTARRLTKALVGLIGDLGRSWELWLGRCMK